MTVFCYRERCFGKESHIAWFAHPAVTADGFRACARAAARKVLANYPGPVPLDLSGEIAFSQSVGLPLVGHESAAEVSWDLMGWTSAAAAADRDFDMDGGKWLFERFREEMGPWVALGAYVLGGEQEEQEAPWRDLLEASLDPVAVPIGDFCVFRQRPCERG